MTKGTLGGTGTVTPSETKEQPVTDRPLQLWLSLYDWQTKAQPATTKQPP